MGFEAHYPPETLAHGETTARILTREWERKDMDMLFGSGVKTSLQYGASVFKQMWGHAGVEARVIMPWQFGVYREDINNTDDQEALSESGLMTVHEVWRRISHLPNAERMYRDIVAHAGRDTGNLQNGSFLHNVLSSSILNTSGTPSARPQSGGVVQLGNSSDSRIGPATSVDLVAYHELWIKDDDREDYTTVLLIEPDIIVSPYLKRENMFAAKTQPYTLIQPNLVPGDYWGQSEIEDLTEPQGLLSDWMDEIRRLMRLQFEKLLAFTGAEGITDEKYGEFRASGYIDMPPGSSVNDLTPPLPPQAFQAIEVLKGMMDEISGFGNILSGQGEPGVRAGNQAEHMTKLASPRLRDRSLLVERQCAAAADKTLDLLQAKDGKVYQTTEGKEFLLHDLPDDRWVTVDSHSSSPIFSDDHQQLIAFGLKAGFVGGNSAIEMLPFPNKDILLQRLKEMEAAKAKMIQEHPEILGRHKPKK